MAVVGAGPCGTTLANLLGTYGVPTMLLDREPTYPDPRPQQPRPGGRTPAVADVSVHDVDGAFRAMASSRDAADHRLPPREAVAAAR